MSFYKTVLQRMLDKGVISKSDHVLVVCAGNSDRVVFLELGFENVVISNLSAHAGVEEYEPYSWDYQDAEAISHDDDSFDWVFVHAGLHHCASPHKAMCEMLRVARQGIVVFEARDSLLMRTATRFGMVPDYELEPLALSNGTRGGYRDSIVPNYVYRWTEREVEKAINSYSPEFKHEFQYHYEYRVPTQRLAMSPSIVKRMIGQMFRLVVPLAKAIFPKQGNEFAFVVSKRGPLHPWLVESDNNIKPNMQYLRDKFHSERYSGTSSNNSNANAPSEPA